MVCSRLTRPIIIALDFSQAESALALTERLGQHRCRVKVGKELFTRAGPSLIERLARQEFDVFLDLKFHDIPNTVARAVACAADLGVWMVNVHALGGRAMLSAAREALVKYRSPPLLAAVTVLTSLDAEDLQAIGLHGSVTDNVLRLARLAESCGVDGLVCSPQEISPLRQALGQNLKLITPGIRPAGGAVDDQKRTLTPAEALRQGADYLVIGRPITAAADPLEALLAIEESLN